MRYYCKNQREDQMIQEEVKSLYWQFYNKMWGQDEELMNTKVKKKKKFLL